MSDAFSDAFSVTPPRIKLESFRLLAECANQYLCIYIIWFIFKRALRS